MIDEPKFRAAVEAAMEATPEDPPPNPKREVPMPEIFTRVEDFLNTPLFESGERREEAKRRRFEPGTLLNVIACIAGLASVSAALYWYTSAQKYQKLSADLAGDLTIALEQQLTVEEPEARGRVVTGSSPEAGGGYGEPAGEGQSASVKTSLSNHERPRQDSGSN